MNGIIQIPMSCGIEIGEYVLFEFVLKGEFTITCYSDCNKTNVLHSIDTKDDRSCESKVVFSWICDTEHALFEVVKDSGLDNDDDEWFRVSLANESNLIYPFLNDYPLLSPTPPELQRWFTFNREAE